MGETLQSAGRGPTVGQAVAALVLAVAVAIAGLVVAALLTLTAGVLLGLVGVQLDVTGGLVLTLVLTQGVAFGGVALGYLRYRGLGRSFVPARVPTRRDVGWAVGGYVLGLTAAILSAIAVFLTGVNAASNQVAELGIQNPGVLLWLVPLSFVLIGPGEELLFRGVVQGTLRQTFGPVVGVVLASAIFAGVHFFALTGGAGGRLVSVGLLFFPSLVFGAAYERTGNLVVPALIHGAYNATLFGLLYVALT